MQGKKNVWFSTILLFLAFGLVLAGCQQGAAPPAEETAAGDSAQPAPAPPAAAPSAPSAPSGQNTAAAPRAAQPPAAPQPAARPPAPPRSITLSAGTPLKVRTTTTISTQSHKAGDSFAASLEEALRQGDLVIAPRGATVEGRVLESDPGGRVSGVAHITVALDSVVTAEGQTVSLETNPIRLEAPRSRGEDATRVGIATGIGAAVGAIAGGGRGAAIGAATGAGAGTGVVLATRGDAAEIASETVLDFQLTAPVTITEARE